MNKLKIKRGQWETYFKVKGEKSVRDETAIWLSRSHFVCLWTFVSVEVSDTDQGTRYSKNIENMINMTSCSLVYMNESCKWFVLFLYRVPSSTGNLKFSTHSSDIKTIPNINVLLRWWSDKRWAGYVAGMGRKMLKMLGKNIWKKWTSSIRPE
jgi:hypothetical protein